MTIPQYDFLDIIWAFCLGNYFTSALHHRKKVNPIFAQSRKDAKKELTCRTFALQFFARLAALREILCFFCQNSFNMAYSK
jgi:hypothetical protein